MPLSVLTGTPFRTRQPGGRSAAARTTPRPGPSGPSGSSGASRPRAFSSPLRSPSAPSAPLRSSTSRRPSTRPRRRWRSAAS
eukprot:13471516-Alexandrium_andersonii.AAC.1